MFLFTLQFSCRLTLITSRSPVSNVRLVLPDGLQHEDKPAPQRKPGVIPKEYEIPRGGLFAALNELDEDEIEEKRKAAEELARQQAAAQPRRAERKRMEVGTFSRDSGSGSASPSPRSSSKGATTPPKRPSKRSGTWQVR